MSGPRWGRLPHDEDDRRPRYQRRNAIGLCGLVYCDRHLSRRPAIVCAHHWFLIPEQLRKSVWAAYRTGSETLYRRACALALGAVDEVSRPADAETVIVKRCGCGESYSILQWLALPDPRDQPDGAVVIEMRDCSCTNTMCIYRDTSTGVYLEQHPEDIT